jgi:hypothetical protein
MSAVSAILDKPHESVKGLLDLELPLRVASSGGSANRAYRS